MRALLIEESAVFRTHLAAILSAAGIDVVGRAGTTRVGQTLLGRQRPDVVTLDVHIKSSDGFDFLRQVVREHDAPVVVVSGAMPPGSAAASQVLALGAAGVVQKPEVGGCEVDSSFAQALLTELRRVGARGGTAGLSGFRPHNPRPAAPRTVSPARRLQGPLICIGASTGGPAALEVVLRAVGARLSGTVVAQHMRQGYTLKFAEHLGQVSGADVREGETGMPVDAGRVIIAPAGRHMVVRGRAGSYTVAINDSPPVNRHRPSVDVLFQSVAKAAGSDVIGVLMTGMQKDGAVGLKCVRDAGGYTIAQDEASCIVFSMPKAAIELDAVDRVVGLGKLGPVLLQLAARGGRL